MYGNNESENSSYLDLYGLIYVILKQAAWEYLYSNHWLVSLIGGLKWVHYTWLFSHFLRLCLFIKKR